MIDTFYNEHGQLVTEEITPERRIQMLKRANEIHQEDVYEAIGLLREILPSTPMCDWAERCDMFLSKLSGPPRG